MRRRIITPLLFVVLLATGLHSRSLWQDRNMYGSGEYLKEGDIVQVHINDISQIKFNLTVNSDSSFTFTSNPDNSITKFLPKASGNKSSVNKGKTSVSGAGKMVLSIPATVTKKLQNNRFEIAGAREYSLHGIVNSFQVAGIVDSTLIKGRAVDSTDVANFRFSLRGYKEGAGITIKRDPPKEGETLTTDLTEDERRKVIMDYLTKVINELTQ